MTKQKWKIHKHPKTGEIITEQWYRSDRSELIEIDNFVFDDTIIYETYNNSPSSVELKFKSTQFPDTKFRASMRFLDNIFDKDLKSNIQIVCPKPLTLHGRFTFAKKGDVIHLEEVI